MSRPSPASATKHEDVDSSESSQAVGWDMAGPSLQLQDAVVETITTHVVRKTTSFRPITLPHIPPPTRLDLPRHLPAERYPLASAPNLFTGAITASVGGQILSFTERSAPSSRPALRPGQTWARVSSTAPSKAAIEASILNSHDTAEPSPRHHLTPPRTEGKSRSRAESINGSPPRKRTRTATRGTQGPLPSPMPSPQRDGPPSISTAGPSTQSTSSARNTGTGLDVAALLSLPAIMEHFDQLHDKAKLHVLEYMLRRSNRSVIQQVAAFAGSGLHRDMIADLPQEVAVQVFKSLDTRSLGRAAQVSKTWARLIDNERGIWLQRLVQEDLYLGHGIEENDEKVLARRMRLIDEYNKPTSRLEWPVALKHVFRRRFCSARNWLHKKPVHTSCPAVGSPGSIVTGTQFANGKIITARDRKVMHVYDVKTGQLLTRLRGHTEGIWAMDAYGNTLATGATDRTLRVWNVNTGRAHIFQGHISTIRCLKIVQPVWYENEQCFFPPCPLVVSGSRDGTLRVWRIPEEGEPYHNDFVSKVAVGVPPERNPYFLHMAVGHTDAIRAMAVHGRTVITASYDRSVRVWDVIDGSAKKVLMGHTDKVYSVVYDKYRNRCASGSVDNTVRIWDVGTGECLHLLDGHIALVGMLESSANRLLLAASDTSLCLLDAERYQKSSRVNTQGSAISAFTHDHIKTVYAADGALRLFDTRAGKHVRTLTTGVTAAWQCVIKDNYLIVSSNRNSAKVYDIFDFGKLDHPSGIDDESIDDIEGPEWKRLLPQTLDRKWYPQPSTHVKGKGKARVVSRYRHDLYDDDGGTSDAVPVSNDPTSEESDEGDEDSEDGVLFDNTVEHDVDDHEDERLYQLDDDYEMDAEEQPQPPSTHISASDGINDQMVEESEEEAEEDVEEGTGGVVYEAGESDDDTEGEDEYEQSAIDASTIDPAPPADWMGNLSESGARFIPWPQFDDYRAEEAHAGPSTAPLAPAADRNTLIRTAANPTLQQRLEQRANAAILNASSSPMLDAPGSSRSTTRARTQLVAVHQADNTAHQAQLVQGGSSTGVHDTDAVLAAVAMPGLAAGGGARSSPRFPTRSPIAHATSAERETGYYTADVPVFGNRSNKRAGATDSGSPLPRSAPRLGAGLVSGSREMMIPSSAGGSVAGPSGTHGSGASAQDIMSSEQIGDNWFEEE